MRKTVEGFRWLSISITVAILVTVFWVWPAWNSGSQTWYWGNNNNPGTINTMYRSTHPPSGQNNPFVFSGTFMGAFMANEAALHMLNFGPNPWQYQIEWYLSPMQMAMGGEMVNYSLTIGRWSGMSMMMMSMYVPLFSAMGSGMVGFTPFRAMGTAFPIQGMMTDFAFMPGDILGAMAVITSPNGLSLTLDLVNSCYITSSVSDPGYPGFSSVSAPTLSQWGMLALAILLASFSTFVINRRIRPGRS